MIMFEVSVVVKIGVLVAAVDVADGGQVDINV
jgi:hypothetical protein